MTTETRPAPLDTTKGEQKDDNIDDLGRRPDGSTQDQPVDPKPEKAPADKEKRQASDS